jgi:hypothetical protein
MGQSVCVEHMPTWLHTPMQPADVWLQKDGTDEPDVPRTHWGACSSRFRLSGNRHLLDCVESIIRNLGDPSDNANESGSSGLETTSKSSDVSEGSQRGHSTQSAGKPRTGGRATACQVLQSTTTPLYTREPWLGAERKRR